MTHIQYTYTIFVYVNKIHISHITYRISICEMALDIYYGPKWGPSKKSSIYEYGGLLS